MIDLNPDLNLFPAQLGIELGIFFASYAVLNKVLYKPYLELVHARNAKSTELKAQSATQKEQAIKFQTDYEEFMKTQRKEVAQWLDEEKKKVAEEERKTIEAARAQVAESMAKTKKATDEQIDIARKELLPLVGEYSSKIVAKLTGKKVSISSAGTSTKKEMEERL
ncbi:hypothetical protein EBQ90_12470 [bacterium]|nr:hypothetical protein [bacterium]